MYIAKTISKRTIIHVYLVQRFPNPKIEYTITNKANQLCYIFQKVNLQLRISYQKNVSKKVMA